MKNKAHTMRTVFLIFLTSAMTSKFNQHLKTTAAIKCSEGFNQCFFYYLKFFPILFTQIIIMLIVL